MNNAKRFVPRSVKGLLLFLGAVATALVPLGSQAQTPSEQTANLPTPEQVAQPSQEEVVKMEAFNVSTTIGLYHEESSSMATKVPTDLKEIASSLQILNANALSDRNVVNMQDIYNYIIGMTQTQANVNGFTFRGFATSGSFTQNIEFDGLQGTVEQKGGLNAADVESVEFLKGPNSVLYGRMNPGGLMNIVTKSPQEKQAETFTGLYQTYGGQFDNVGDENSWLGTMDLTGPIDKEKHWLYRLIVSEDDMHPWRKGDWEKDIYFYPSLTYKWSENTYLNLKVEEIRERGRQDDGLIPIFPGYTTGGSVAGYVLGPYNDVYQEPTDTALNKGQSYSAYFQTRFNDLWTLRISSRNVYQRNISHEMTDIVSGLIIPAANPITATTIKRQYNLQDNAHRYDYFDANLYGKIGPSHFENTILVGVSGGVESFDQFRHSFGPLVAPLNILNPILGVTPYPPDGTKTSDPKQFLSSLGEYVTDMIRIGDSWHVTMGTRYDQQVAHGIDPLNLASTPYTHQFTSADTSQFGVIYDVTKELSSYVSVSQSFIPNQVTRFNITGNNQWPPEEGYQFEGGLKFESRDRSLFASVDLYFINRTNIQTATGTLLPDGLAIYRLDGEQHSEGGELEFEWRPLLNWQFQGGLSLGKEFTAESATNPHIVGFVGGPTSSASLWTRYNVPKGPLKGLGIGVGYVYQGSNSVNDPTLAPWYVVPGWYRIDSNIYYKWRRYEFAFDIKNLLDRRYIQFARANEVLVPGDERRFTVTATAHF